MKTKRIFLIVLITSSLLLMHCDSCLLGCDTGPFFGQLEIKLTTNDENTEIPIEIFEGNFDDGVSLLLDTIQISEIENGRVIYDDFEAGFFYSVTATYQQGTKTIIAIDGDEMALEYDDCDCEYPTDLVLNVRLAK